MKEATEERPMAMTDGDIVLGVAGGGASSFVTLTP